MNALALTDHGNLYGALEFYQKAKAAGINPIVGYEAYIAPGSRRHKEVGKNEEASYHLTLLAQNRTGFQNLIKLSSSAFLEGFYFKPRIDKEILAGPQRRADLPQRLRLGRVQPGPAARQCDLETDEAMQMAAWFHKLFGERYFIEIQNNGLDIQRMAMEGAVDMPAAWACRWWPPATSHYVNREDAEAQDVLLCINTGRFRTDTNRMRMEADSSTSAARATCMRRSRGWKTPWAAASRSPIGQHRTRIGQTAFPSFRRRTEKRRTITCANCALRGCTRRYADEPGETIDGQLSDEVIARLEHELDVINKLGFAELLPDRLGFRPLCHGSSAFRPRARGSGVGSLVSYVLGLSHVCPLKYDLLFERFLDINRLEAPDIDIDFCKDRRNEVIQYVKDKYGEANVAQIGTFGTLAARAAIRDVGRALGMPIPRVDTIVAMVPDALHITLKQAIEAERRTEQGLQADREVGELMDLAMKIEGLARNVGTHAAAVVIADKPLTDYVPLQRVQGKEEVITQWAMGDVEAAGLLKMDFLGLRNLTILAKAVRTHQANHRPRVDPYKFPLDDQETFALLCRGETKGIFQLESGGIRDLLQRMKPDHFRDIIATNALYRPGPLEGGMVDDYIQVKHGRKKAEYKHPVMKDILEETHGVMVYQEQVMRILNRLGGIELSNAYACIKAISKKKLATIAKFREQFIEGTVEQGLKKTEAADLFDMIEKFAGYGFNKSHSTAYALIAYMTAYLKAHYPVEFMAALLSGDIAGRNFKKKDSLVEHLEDCRRMNITVVPPDVNACDADFPVQDGKICFGLAAMKGCGGGSRRRQSAPSGTAAGPFRDLFDFCQRIDPATCNRTAIESLIKAGAFDHCDGKRSQWMAVLDRALQAGAATLADRRRGQKGLFDDTEDEPDTKGAVGNLPNLPEWEEREKLAWKKKCSASICPAIR